MNIDKIDNIINQLKNTLFHFDHDLSNWELQYFSTQLPRYRYLLERISQYEIEGDILEIGCIPCHLSYCLKNIGIHSVGVDLNPDRFQKSINRNQLEVYQCDIEKENLPFNNNRFKFIIFSEVFEHLRINPIFTLKELFRVLAPEGTLLLTTPNLNYLPNRISMFRGHPFDNPYNEFEKLDYLGHMGHIREYNPIQIHTFLNKTGFTKIDIEFDMFGTFTHKPYNFIIRFLCNFHPKFRRYIIATAKK